MLSISLSGNQYCATLHEYESKLGCPEAAAASGGLVAWAEDIVAGVVVSAVGVLEEAVSAALDVSVALVGIDEGDGVEIAVEVVRRRREHCLSERRGQAGLRHCQFGRGWTHARFPYRMEKHIAQQHDEAPNRHLFSCASRFCSSPGQPSSRKSCSMKTTCYDDFVYLTVVVASWRCAAI